MYKNKASQEYLNASWGENQSKQFHVTFLANWAPLKCGEKPPALSLLPPRCSCLALSRIWSIPLWCQRFSGFGWKAFSSPFPWTSMRCFTFFVPVTVECSVRVLNVSLLCFCNEHWVAEYLCWMLFLSQEDMQELASLIRTPYRSPPWCQNQSLFPWRYNAIMISAMLIFSSILKT